MTYIGRLPQPTNQAWDWQVHAACRGMASSLFFHEWGERGPSREERVRQAKTVCQACPVIDACRRHALQVREQYGIWGGLSEEERLELLNPGRRSPRQAPAQNRKFSNPLVPGIAPLSPDQEH